MKKGRMTDTASSSWRTAFISAQLEHDPNKVAARIAEARDAINLRLNGSTEIGQSEHDAIEAARHGLDSLRAQRVSMVGETLGL
jgi:GTP cyclohydrolase III